MPPEKRYSFMKDYTNVIGWNIRKTNKMNPTFIFPSSIRIFKSTSCFRNVKELICNSISCFEFAIPERKRKVSYYLHVCYHYRKNSCENYKRQTISLELYVRDFQTVLARIPYTLQGTSQQLTSITSMYKLLSTK